MCEMSPSRQWVRDEGFDLLCRRLTDVFPRTAPESVVDEGDGDFGKAQAAFRLHGSHWSCTAVMENRSIAIFVNEATFLFLLPRMISCCLGDDGLNGDIFDSLVFGLEYRLPKFSALFSSEQRAKLLAPLQYLFGGVILEYSAPESQAKTMRRILAKLRN